MHAYIHAHIHTNIHLQIWTCTNVYNNESSYVEVLFLSLQARTPAGGPLRSRLQPGAA